VQSRNDHASARPAPLSGCLHRSYAGPPDQLCERQGVRFGQAVGHAKKEGLAQVVVVCYNWDVSRYRMALIPARFLRKQVPGYFVFTAHITRPVRAYCAGALLHRLLASKVVRQALPAGEVCQPQGRDRLQNVNARPAWRAVRLMSDRFALHCPFI
jgi:hypothetical protein